MVERVRALERLCEEHGVPLRTAALQVPFVHPAVVSVLQGCESPVEKRWRLASRDSHRIALNW